MALAKAFRHDLPVLTSPAVRAIETAAALGLVPQIDDGLRDVDLGRWAGCTLSGIATSDPEGLENWLSDPGSAPHGGESIDSLCARTAIWLKAISSRGQGIIAISHPAVIRAAILAAIHAGPTSFWHIDIGPLCVVELGYVGR